MPRAKRTVIDNLEATGFENIGRSWTHRENWISYGTRSVPTEDDRFTLDIPAFAVAGGGFYTQVTIWSTGLISFGAVTQAQIAYMAGLSVETDLVAFLAGFPGDFVDAGFQASAYLQVEFGTGLHDVVGNPLGPDGRPLLGPDGLPSGELRYDRGEAEQVCYAAFGREPLPDDANRNDPTATVLRERISVNFTDEGFRVAAAGTYRLGGATVTLAKNTFVYFSDLDIWIGTEADDVQRATALQTLDGRGGADRLSGADGADHLLGGTGDDQLTGGGGIDRLDGGDGDDVLVDGDERGTLLGGRGADVLVSGRGEDVIDGGRGVDTLVLNYHRSTEATTMSLKHSKIDYYLDGEYKQISGIEVLRFTGGSNRDMIDGGSGDDLLRQRGGGGRLQGRDGDDELVGGSGEDHLVGGSGADTLIGGDGADVFVYRAFADLQAPDGGRDFILDFAHGDLISLRAIDTDPAADGDQAFRFVGHADLSGSGTAEIHTYVFDRTVNYVQFDVDGDGQIDAELVVLSDTRLTAQDFVL